MTRIAVIGPMPPLKGGISQHTARIAEAAIEAGHEVDVISWKSQYPRVLYGRDQIEPGSTTTADVHWSLQWWNPITWVRAALRARSADVVIQPWVSPFHALTNMTILLFCRNTRRVVHVHNVTPHETFPAARLLARIVLGRADQLVCHASSILADLRELNIHVPALSTSHPPDLPIRVTPPPERPPFRLLFLGTIRHYKGLDIALEAIPMLTTPVTFTVAGEVWHEAPHVDIESLREAGVEVDLRLRYIPDDELIELLASHHVLVAPYRSATQSGVVSLAHAAGRPVVATNVGGLPDAVSDGHTGVLCEPENPSAFAAGIERALTNFDALADSVATQQSSWSGYLDELLGSALSQ